MTSGAFTNNGFILVANTEVDDRFNYKSSDNSTAAQRPKLVIQYTLPPTATPTATQPPATSTSTPTQTPTATATYTMTPTAPRLPRLPLFRQLSLTMAMDNG